MRYTRRQRELAAVAVAAGLVAVLGEAIKPGVLSMFKAKRRRIPR